MPHSCFELSKDCGLFCFNFISAMAAELTKRFMSIEDLVNLFPEPVAKKRGEYK
jgi:hypothetical protein